MTDGPREQSPADGGSPEALAAYPELSDGQLARLRAYGSPDDVSEPQAWAQLVESVVSRKATDLERS